MTPYTRWTWCTRWGISGKCDSGRAERLLAKGENMPTMTGAEALVRSLVREGVEVVFALPGVQIMHIFDALSKEPSIRLVTVRHEQGTTYMAMGYARTTGKVGVALVVPGPGALNASAGLGTAYASSLPVMLISGQMERSALGKYKGALHEVQDQLDVFRPITKSAERVLEVEEIPDAVHRGMTLAASGRQRPTEIEIPWDVLPQTGDVELPEPAIITPAQPDPARIRDAAQLLAEAQRPVIWAGGGAINADASEELTKLSELLGAPVITTPEGKGAISEDHSLAVGAFYSGHGAAYHALPKADVILAVGSRLHLTPSVPWAFTSEQKLVQIDADPEEVGRNHEVAVGIAADARTGLAALLGEMEGLACASQWTPQDVDSIKEATREDVRRMAPLQVEMGEVIRQELDDDAIIVGGITNVAYWCHLSLPVRKPRSYVTSSYFATLGYAFPTAVGAKIGNPDKQVVALCGDGGFMFGIPDLATAVQEGANLVALVFNNGAFGASRMDQGTRFGGRYYGTTVHNPDFVKMAESFGAYGMKVDDPSTQLRGVLREALAKDGPVIVDVTMPDLNPPFQIPPHGTNRAAG